MRSVAPAASAASTASPAKVDRLDPVRRRRCRGPDHRRDHLLALGQREHRRLAGIDADADDHAVGQRQRAGKDVDVPVGHRVEGARIEGDARHGRGFYAPGRPAASTRASPERADSGYNGQNGGTHGQDQRRPAAGDGARHRHRRGPRRGRRERRFLGAQWEAGLAGLGRGPFGFGDIALFNLWALVIGFAAAWIYAGFRPRFGSGALTATYAALTVWVIGYFLRYTVMGMLGMPAGLMAIAGAAALVGTVVATIVGMHVYQEA